MWCVSVSINMTQAFVFLFIFFSRVRMITRRGVYGSSAFGMQSFKAKVKPQNIIFRRMYYGNILRYSLLTLFFLNFSFQSRIIRLLFLLHCRCTGCCYHEWKPKNTSERQYFPGKKLILSECDFVIDIGCKLVQAL